MFAQAERIDPSSSASPVVVLSVLPSPDIPISDKLVSMVLREVGHEPQRNGFTCSRCGSYFFLSSMNGKPCTHTFNGARPCWGIIRPECTRETVQQELVETMLDGNVALAWTSEVEPTLLGFAMCRSEGMQTIPATLKMPMSVLEPIYGQLGRDGPYLVLTHLWVEGMPEERVPAVIRGLLGKVVESEARRYSISTIPVLIPVDAHESELRHAALVQMGFRVLAKDMSRGRSRCILRAKLRVS
ncbi:MAG: hypothetical protein WC654_01325 [Patescibacteria group bacterium]